MSPSVLRWLACFMVLGASLCKVACAELTPGDHQFTIVHDGRERTYLVHVPKDVRTSPWPVVINFHGGGSSAAGQQAYCRMDPVADREGFLVVYPNGTGVFAARLLTWNAGSCCGYAMQKNVDDVGFVQALIEDLDRRAGVNRGRIYATGLSNGAMMAYRVAAEVPDLLAAIAPVAGARSVASTQSEASVSILHIHSVDDTRALYNGGLGPPYPLTDIRVQHPAVEALLARWAEFDECPSQPSVGPTVTGKGRSATHTATRVSYGPCKDGSEVVLLKLTGAGHVWPGAASEYLSMVLGSQSKVLGPPTDVIDANTQMWEFFSLHHLSQ